MTNVELDLVATLNRNGIRPSQIHTAIREQFHGSKCKIKDIYNALSKIKDPEKIGDTPMKVLENFFHNNGFMFYTRQNSSTDRTKDIFFCYNKSHKIWRAFSKVLLIDTTHNPNMYKWSLVQFVGVTSTSKSFYIAHTFLIRETEKNFTWALKKLKRILEDCMEPHVIRTDVDRTLMKSCNVVF
ncbi:protein FAR-RED ELONGATED HYPOCOTYL 3-like [Bidens hawaiensis]|uniref:protein FAR-RED ELONGATED HYPOCOTYL 3-like n=1 Tax=Bidens hawaiensis TaxID=980011 RepID=UPI0040495A35